MPETLGKYEIIEEVGKGGFATVYRARDPDLDRIVALKVLDPLLTRDPVWVARFRREARAVARLDHPHVVTIHEVGQAEGVIFIATRLVEGGSLAKHIAAQGPLPWEQVVCLASEIASALDYAHEQGVVHRDLKAANVLLDRERGAQLTDFGFARLVAESSLSVSVTGGIVGTPHYIAPEIWHGQPATPQTDIYALGAVLYEALMGEHLFQGDTPPAVMMAHFQPPAWPDPWPEGVPPGLEEVLDVALAQEPEARYARAGELAGALVALHADRLAEPYAELEAAVADQHWEEAIRLAGEIQAEDADYRDVAALEGTALEGLERAARAREAATWWDGAEKALAVGNLSGAEMAARQWAALTPEDPELKGFLTRLERAKVPAPLEPPAPNPPHAEQIKPVQTQDPGPLKPPIRSEQASTARESTVARPRPSGPAVSRPVAVSAEPKAGIPGWLWVAAAALVVLLSIMGIGLAVSGRPTPEPEVIVETVPVEVTRIIEREILVEATRKVPTAEREADVKEAEAGKRVNMVLLPKFLGISVFDQAYNGAKEAHAELQNQGELQFLGPTPDNSVFGQIEIVTNATTQGADAIMISNNAGDQIAPAAQAARDAGVTVVTWDSPIPSAEGEQLFIAQVDFDETGKVMADMALDILGEDGGKFTVLSASPDAANQNAWIAALEEVLATDPTYANLELLDIVYGNDQSEDSYNQALALVSKYPDMELIMAPTTIGIASAAKAMQDEGLCDTVKVSGLGLPSEMVEFTLNGCSPEFALWSFVDLGYLTYYTTYLLAIGAIEGKVGERFEAGRMGTYTVERDPNRTRGVRVLMGPWKVYDASNIGDKVGW